MKKTDTIKELRAEIVLLENLLFQARNEAKLYKAIIHQSGIMHFEQPKPFMTTERCVIYKKKENE